MSRVFRLSWTVASLVLLLAGGATPLYAQSLDSAAGVSTAVAEDTATELPKTPIALLPASALNPLLLPLPQAQLLTVPLNQRVLSYIELFQGKLHDFIETGMRNGSKYLPMIQKIFTAQGLPPDLAYVPLVESAFRPEAISRASAKGVWQFMKGTALENGLQHNFYIDERSNPEKATIAAANYLKTLADTFEGPVRSSTSFFAWCLPGLNFTQMNPMMHQMTTMPTALV